MDRFDCRQVPPLIIRLPSPIAIGADEEESRYSFENCGAHRHCPGKSIWSSPGCQDLGIETKATRSVHARDSKLSRLEAGCGKDFDLNAAIRRPKGPDDLRGRGI